MNIPMKRVLAASVLIALMVVFQLLAAGGDAAKQAAQVKEALQALQDYIGGWKGNGSSEKDKLAIWNEKVNWGWKFKGNDAWLIMEFAESKFYKNGEMRYLPAKKSYQL